MCWSPVDGQEALDLLRSENIHAVLCDLKMPVKGAIEVLEVSKPEYVGNVPVIILTGQGTRRVLSNPGKRGLMLSSPNLSG